MKELKTIALALNLLVIVVMIGGFLSALTSSGSLVRYFAVVMMVAFPSFINVFVLWRTWRKSNNTYQSNGLQWTYITRILAIAANGIYLVLVANTIYEKQFNGYVALLAIVYAISFYVLWRDWRINKPRQGQHR